VTHSFPLGGKWRVGSVLREGLLVLAVGGLVALAANFLSPRGLSLTRNYFPVSDQAPVANPDAASPADPAARTRDYFKAQGLQVADFAEAARLFRDPRREQELIVFVDARNEEHYAAGHVPGAYLFDHYRPENYLPGLLPVCQTAETVMIYCTGGTCEDSGFAARTLREAGVPAEKLVIFPGGITEWQGQGLPLETGPRLSGILSKPQ
jgi:rhodanese-related sulfurtransferase